MWELNFFFNAKKHNTTSSCFLQDNYRSYENTETARYTWCGLVMRYQFKVTRQNAFCFNPILVSLWASVTSKYPKSGSEAAVNWALAQSTPHPSVFCILRFLLPLCLLWPGFGRSQGRSVSEFCISIRLIEREEANLAGTSLPWGQRALLYPVVDILRSLQVHGDFSEGKETK